MPAFGGEFICGKNRTSKGIDKFNDFLLCTFTHTSALRIMRTLKMWKKRNIHGNDNDNVNLNRSMWTWTCGGGTRTQQTAINCQTNESKKNCRTVGNAERYSISSFVLSPVTYSRKSQRYTISIKEWLISIALCITRSILYAMHSIALLQ